MEALCVLPLTDGEIRDIHYTQPCRADTAAHQPHHTGRAEPRPRRILSACLIANVYILDQNQGETNDDSVSRIHLADQRST